jgi:hypothetical protein
LLNAKNISWPRTNGHFADESSSPQPASVWTTAARNAVPPISGGHIDRTAQANLRNLLCYL